MSLKRKPSLRQVSINELSESSDVKDSDPPKSPEVVLRKPLARKASFKDARNSSSPGDANSKFTFHKPPLKREVSVIESILLDAENSTTEESSPEKSEDWDNLKQDATRRTKSVARAEDITQETEKIRQSLPDQP